jgi:hypothetical protein
MEVYSWTSCIRDVAVWMYIRARFLLAFCCVKRDECRSSSVFGTMTQDLHELAEWLRQFGVTQVAMESSGVYWRPCAATMGSLDELPRANACRHFRGCPGTVLPNWPAQKVLEALLMRRCPRAREGQTRAPARRSLDTSEVGHNAIGG